MNLLFVFEAVIVDPYHLPELAGWIGQSTNAAVVTLYMIPYNVQPTLLLAEQIQSFSQTNSVPQG